MRPIIKIWSFSNPKKGSSSRYWHGVCWLFGRLCFSCGWGWSSGEQGWLFEVMSSGDRGVICGLTIRALALNADISLGKLSDVDGPTILNIDKSRENKRPEDVNDLDS